MLSIRAASISLEKLASFLPPHTKVYRPSKRSNIFGNLTIAKSYINGSPERLAIDRSYQETMDVLLIVAACLAAPLIPLSLLMRNYKLDSIDQKVRGMVIGHDRAQDEGATEVQGDEGEARRKGFLGRFSR